MNITITSKGLKCTVEYARSVQGNAVIDVEHFAEFHFNSENDKETFAVPLGSTLCAFCLVKYSFNVH